MANRQGGMKAVATYYIVLFRIFFEGLSVCKILGFHSGADEISVPLGCCTASLNN